MKNIVKKRSGGFTITPNELINDSTISFKAKGVYGYMYSKNDTWQFSIDRIANDGKEGRRAVMEAIKELKKAGWVSYQKNSDGTGTYFLEDKPNPKCYNSNEAQTQSAKIAICQNSNLPKQQRINKKEDFNKKEETNKKERNKENLLSIFDNLLFKKIGSKIPNIGKHSRANQKEALNDLIKEKGEGCADFIKDCFQVENDFYLDKLTPIGISRNIIGFNAEVSKLKKVAPANVPKLYTTNQVLTLGFHKDKFKAIKTPDGSRWVDMKEYKKAGTTYTPLIDIEANELIEQYRE